MIPSQAHPDLGVAHQWFQATLILDNQFAAAHSPTFRRKRACWRCAADQALNAFRCNVRKAIRATCAALSASEDDQTGAQALRKPFGE